MELAQSYEKAKPIERGRGQRFSVLWHCAMIHGMDTMRSGLFLFTIVKVNTAQAIEQFKARLRANSQTMAQVYSNLAAVYNRHERTRRVIPQAEEALTRSIQLRPVVPGICQSRHPVQPSKKTLSGVSRFEAKKAPSVD